MILNIYLIGVAIAFVLLLIHSILNSKYQRVPTEWVTEIILIVIMTLLSWFSAFLVIISLRPAYSAAKARKEEEKSTTEYIYAQWKKDKACLKTKRNHLRPVLRVYIVDASNYKGANDSNTCRFLPIDTNRNRLN